MFRQLLNRYRESPHRLSSDRRRQFKRAQPRSGSPIGRSRRAKCHGVPVNLLQFDRNISIAFSADRPPKGLPLRHRGLLNGCTTRSVRDAQ